MRKCCAVLVVTIFFLPLASARARGVRKPMAASEVPKVIAELSSTDEKKRCMAAHNLDFTEAPDLVRKELRKFLELARNSDNCTKVGALNTISILWPQTKEAFDIALANLDSNDSSVQWPSANVVGTFACGAKDPQWLPKIEKAYEKHKKEDSVNTRLVSAAGCYRLAALPFLEKELDASDRFVQSTVIVQMGNIARDTKDPAVKKKLIDRLKKLKPHKDNEALYRSHLKMIEMGLQTP